jgi:hypothetical protein
MRLLGYTLLIIGFGVICWKNFQARDIIYGTALEQSQWLQQHSDEKIEIALIRATHETWDRSAPWFSSSAAVMVVGGILLDIGARRRKIVTNIKK